MTGAGRVDGSNAAHSSRHSNRSNEKTEKKLSATQRESLKRVVQDGKQKPPVPPRTSSRRRPKPPMPTQDQPIPESLMYPEPILETDPKFEPKPELPPRSSSLKYQAPEELPMQGSAPQSAVVSPEGSPSPTRAGSRAESPATVRSYSDVSDDSVVLEDMESGNIQVVEGSTRGRTNTEVDRMADEFVRQAIEEADAEEFNPDLFQSDLEAKAANGQKLSVQRPDSPDINDVLSGLKSDLKLLNKENSRLDGDKRNAFRYKQVVNAKLMTIVQLFEKTPVSQRKGLYKNIKKTFPKAINGSRPHFDSIRAELKDLMSDS